MYSTPSLDSLSPYGKLRFYARLLAAQNKDDVLREYKVRVEVAYSFQPASGYYATRLQRQTHEFRNQLVFPQVEMPGFAHTRPLVLDLCRIKFDNPILRILLEFKEGIGLPTALVLLADACLRYPHFHKTTHPFAWMTLVNDVETQGGRMYLWMRKFIEAHYTRLFTEYLGHEVMAGEYGSNLYVKQMTPEIREAIAQHLPFVPYQVEPVKACLFLPGDCVELNEVGEMVRPVNWHLDFLTEELSLAVTTFYRVRKLRALLD